jgi:phosphoribosylanthranilate isomerase
MALAKICGLSTPAAVDAAVAGGAAFIGFVVFEASPRFVTLPLAAALARPARGKAQVVAVTVDPDNDLLDRIMRELQPDLIQLHGAESPERASTVASRTGAGVIKALAVAEAGDLETAHAFEGAARHLMFDAKAPALAHRPGGHGAAFDWSLLKEQRFAQPWFLAGGLDPWNVGAAIAASGAPIADVSSGVERGAGLKDPALITRFLAAASRA